MSHTPEQARTLWCPMVRIARHESYTTEMAAIGDLVQVTEHGHVVSVCNTDALGGFRIPASCRCIADQCAMWRWSNKPSTQAEQSAFDLDQSIDLLALDVRARNALKGEGVFKLNQLVILRSADLGKMPNVGTKTIQEIRQSLAAHGLELSTQKKRAHPPGTGFCGIAGRPEVAA